MTRLDRRLAALERNQPAEFTASQQAWFKELSQVTIGFVGWQLAEDRARADWDAQHGKWSWGRLSQEERSPIIRTYVPGVVQIMTRFMEHAGVIGDDPELAEFHERWRRERDRMDVYRGLRDPIAERWRQLHPEWHPDMPDDEAIAWEWALYAADSR